MNLYLKEYYASNITNMCASNSTMLKFKLVAV